MKLSDAERNEIMSALGELAETVKCSYAENYVELYLYAFDSDAVLKTEIVTITDALASL